jgi:hypothetical protein
VAVARKGGGYTHSHSTASDEQSHRIPTAIANSVSISAGKSAISSGLPLHLLQLENVHYDGGVPWMLIPDEEGVLHIAILTEISPPVTRGVAADIQINLYTKYVLVCFQVLKTKVERLSVSDTVCRENSSDLGRCSSQYLIWVASEYKQKVSASLLCFTNRYSKRRDFCR